MMSLMSALPVTWMSLSVKDTIGLALFELGAAMRDPVTTTVAISPSSPGGVCAPASPAQIVLAAAPVVIASRAARQYLFVSIFILLQTKSFMGPADSCMDPPVTFLSCAFPLPHRWRVPYTSA